MKDAVSDCKVWINPQAATLDPGGGKMFVKLEPATGLARHAQYPQQKKIQGWVLRGFFGFAIRRTISISIH